MTINRAELIFARRMALHVILGALVGFLWFAGLFGWFVIGMLVW